MWKDIFWMGKMKPIIQVILGLVGMSLLLSLMSKILVDTTCSVPSVRVIFYCLFIIFCYIYLDAIPKLID